jgi:Ca2+-binding RTX toxin-like protein
VATVNGTASNDTLTGTSGNDTINGLGGNDLINASGGNDLINGGDGRDSIEYRTATSAIVVDFAAGTITGGGTGSISFTSIERVLGGVFADRMSGDAAGQNLTGKGGNDTLWGAGGIDTLWGGNDADTFNFRETGTANADSIADFVSGTDKILLDGAAFSALSAGGNFVAGDARFAANATGTAQDASDRVIYETDTRQIWYDADGNGAGARQLIATLQSGATLAATDIAVENGSSSGGQTGNGTAGNDSIVGTEGNDTLDGLAGNDTLRGLAGNDSLSGGDGIDVLDGGADDDTLNGGIGDGTYYGGAGNDVFLGGSGNEEFFATGGNDRVETGGGRNDVFIGPILAGVDDGATEYGADTLIGGSGDDQLLLGMRSAVVADLRTGSILGGSQSGGGSIAVSGFDIFQFRGQFSVQFTADDSGVAASTGEGDDTLIGGAGNDSLAGGNAGINVIIAGDGADTLSSDGTSVNTFVFNAPPTASNADLIHSFGTGVDTLQFDASVFTALGPAGRFAVGDERFYSAAGATQGHDATDRLVYNASNGDLWYDADGNGSVASVLVASLPQESGEGPEFIVVASDIVVSGEGNPGGSTINGTSGNDTLTGTSGNDTINGLGGIDVILAGSTGGTDVIDGGADRDSIEFKERATSAVVVDFGSGTITGGSSGSISFTNIERVVGSNFNDSLTGNAAAQNLTGQGGADTLAGAGGVDTLWGGAGGDAFVFREMGTANADRVSDWASGSDKVQLDDSAFTAIGALGNFAAGDGRFWSGAAAHDASDRVIYNQSTGSLYYDADGNGGGAAQLIATFAGNPTVAATDIVVI